MNELKKDTPQEEKAIEEAITFLVNAIKTSGHNPKPVILHSLRVAFLLSRYEYDFPVIIAGILHDVIEDSKTSLAEVEKQFGEEIVTLVAANTVDLSISDRTQRYTASFQQAAQVGKDALRIRAVDMLDNSYYFHRISKKAEKLQWLDKVKKFLSLSKDPIGKEEVWRLLQEKEQELRSTLRE